MTATIGEVEQVDLDIHQNSDLTFGFQWFADEADTDPVVITDAFGMVRKTTLSEVPTLDFADYITIAGHEVSVLVPADVTKDLEPMSNGIWDFFIVGEGVGQRMTVRGSARIYRSATQ